MREVYKKISREYFEQVQSGQKTFEYRVDDFECEPGDILVLEEYEYEEGEETVTARKPTGRVLRRRVGYVAHTKDFVWLKRPDVREAFEQHGAQFLSLLEEGVENVKR